MEGQCSRGQSPQWAVVSMEEEEEEEEGLNKSCETAIRYTFKHEAINTDGAAEVQLQSFSV